MNIKHKKVLISLFTFLGLTGILGVTGHIHVHADLSNMQLMYEENKLRQEDFDLEAQNNKYQNEATWNKLKELNNEYNNMTPSQKRLHNEIQASDEKSDEKQQENNAIEDTNEDNDWYSSGLENAPSKAEYHTISKKDAKNSGYFSYNDLGQLTSIDEPYYPTDPNAVIPKSAHLVSDLVGPEGTEWNNSNYPSNDTVYYIGNGYWSTKDNETMPPDTSSSDQNTDNNTDNTDNTDNNENNDNTDNNENNDTNDNNNDTNSTSNNTSSDGTVIANQYSPYVIQYGKDELSELNKAHGHSQSYYGWVGKELCDSDDENAAQPGEATDFSKRAAWWIASHGLAPLLKDDGYWGSFENNPTIMKMIKQQSKKPAKHIKHNNKNRNKHHNNRKIKKSYKNLSNFYYNRKKYGKKGYHNVYKINLYKHGYRPKFKRSNKRSLLNKSGFRNLRKYGANFIFNKYAPTDKRAIVPKKFNFKHTAWLSGRFGRNHPTVYIYIGKYWFKHK